MKTTIFNLKHLVLAMGATAFLTSCGNVAVEVDEAYTTLKESDAKNASGVYNYSDFNAIEANGAASIYLTQDSVYKFEMKGDKNLISRMKVKQVGNKLVIDDDTDWLDKIEGQKCEIHISLPVLKSLELSGANSTKTTNLFKQSEGITMDLSGAGSMNLNVEAPSLSIDASGATSLNLRGKVTTFKVDMSGAGSVSAMELETEDAEIESSGAGSVSVWANQSLKVDASGVGAVKYKGNATVTKDISGMASVSKVD